MFNKCFVSQSTLDDSQTQLPYDETNPEVLIEQKIILPEEVYEILVNLDISTGYFPEVQKTAHVIPIHKKDLADQHM